MLVKRIVNVWRALLGSGLTKLEAGNAEAMLELERQTLRQTLFRYNRGLAGHAALAERLKGELSKLEGERLQLLPRLALRLELGDRAAAGRHALRAEAIATELEQHTAKVAQTDAMYRELVRSRDATVAAARERIDSLRRSIGQLKVHEALADLSELAAGMQGALGLSDGALERVKARVDERRDYAAGRVRVARELSDMNEPRLLEHEQQALAVAALQRYEAGVGLLTTGATRAHGGLSE